VDRLLIIRSRAGFTLIEILVSMAILAIILVVLAQASNSLSQAVTQTTSEVRQFQAARDAFETMTRRISQATLNAYNDTAANTQLSVSGYTRASELRFISGPASLAVTALNGVSGPLFGNYTNPYHPTHAIFFQAPLGNFANSPPAAANLVQMMNTCGYYIEWNSDVNLGVIPTFISSAIYIPRWRFRLMEMVEPSDSLTIYTKTSGGTTASNSWTYTGKDWFQTPYKNSNFRPIADNIILLAFLPMVAPQNALSPPGGYADGTSTDLAPNYIYDTAPIQAAGSTPLVSQNQLPPMVQVLMIAVDEKSFYAYLVRQGNLTTGTYPTNLGIDGPSANTTFLTNATYTQRLADILQVTTALNSNHIKYRIFSTIVPMTAH
jgi:uncharacterized protein (TIGR02599 family)